MILRFVFHSSMWDSGLIVHNSMLRTAFRNLYLLLSSGDLVTWLGDMTWWHYLVTWFGDMTWWHYLVTLLGDITWWHDLVTWFGDITWWHDLVTWLGDITWWHDLVTLLGDMTWWHYLVTWLGDMIWWHYLVTWFGDMTWWHYLVTWLGDITCDITWWHYSESLSHFFRHSNIADPGGRAVWGVGQRPLALYDCGVESRRGHGCLSVVSVVHCELEASASGWSLVQRSTTECGVSKLDWGCWNIAKKKS